MVKTRSRLGEWSSAEFDALLRLMGELEELQATGTYSQVERHRLKIAAWLSEHLLGEPLPVRPRAVPGDSAADLMPEPSKMRAAEGVTLSAKDAGALLKFNEQLEGEGRVWVQKSQGNKLETGEELDRTLSHTLMGLAQIVASKYGCSEGDAIAAVAKCAPDLYEAHSRAAAPGGSLSRRYWDKMLRG